jgi:transmembrane sensor
MSELQSPLKNLLRAPTTPASVARMWHRIDARARIGRISSPRIARQKSLAWLAAAAVLLTMAVAAASRLYHLDGPARSPDDAVSEARAAKGTSGGHSSGAAAAATSSTQEQRPSAPAALDTTRSPQPPAPKPATPIWKDLARHGQNAKAYEELGPGGVEKAAQSATVDDLLILADVARLSGHPREAVKPLTRVVHEHPADPRASLAAFMLGRVELDSLGAPAAGAAAFERALALGIPGGLAEDAYAGLVKSRAKAGDASGARAAAGEYLARYPSGRRAEEVKRWASEP